jgi:outer membrane lipoprotein-sorting protein
MQVQRRQAALARVPRGVLAFAPLLAAVVSLIACIPAALSARADLFDELFKQGQAKNGAMKTLTANFVETTSSTLLTRPLVSSGTVAVERPARIAMHYSQPDDRIVLIDGDKMTMSWPSKKVRQDKDIGAAQKRIQKYFVGSSPSELRSHFDVNASEATDRPGTYLVAMVPRRKQIKEGLARLDLWVDKNSQMLTAMKMTFPNGDTKLMTFTDVKPNAPVDPTAFHVGR